MTTHPLDNLDSETNAIKDLTTDEVGDISLWIRQQKEYRNVPNFVSNELCQHTSALPSVLAHLPSNSLPVLQLLELTTPQVTEAFQGINPHNLFLFDEPTHTSSECLDLLAPSSNFLTQLRACAGQAMLDGKTSIQHWDRRDVFLPFDTLGTWSQILKINAAKEAWIGALRWTTLTTGRPQAIPEQYAICILSLLRQVPWNGYINGLGSALMITDMASFLSQQWLSDLHIDSMLTVTKHLHHDILSRAVPCTEIVSPNFASHILTSPLLATTPITPNYLAKAPKSVVSLGTMIANAAAGIRIASISFSPSLGVFAHRLPS
jgi:hypothetical protein